MMKRQTGHMHPNTAEGTAGAWYSWTGRYALSPYGSILIERVYREFAMLVPAFCWSRKSKTGLAETGSRKSWASEGHERARSRDEGAASGPTPRIRNPTPHHATLQRPARRHRYRTGTAHRPQLTGVAPKIKPRCREQF